ncbi:helix-turn-helix domain-containing protein [Corynebacterium sp. S7]
MTIDDSTIEEIRGMDLSEGASIKIFGADGQPIPVSENVETLLLQALRSIAESGEFTLSRMSDELSSTAAAELLGVTETTLMKWAREEKIPSHKVNSQTRFLRDDVLQFEAGRETERDRTFKVLREFNHRHDDPFED